MKIKDIKHLFPKEDGSVIVAAEGKGFVLYDANIPQFDELEIIKLDYQYNFSASSYVHALTVFVDYEPLKEFVWSKVR